MRILFIAHNTHLLGATKSMQSVLRYFKQMNVDVHVLMPHKGELYKEMQLDGIKAHTFLFFFTVLYVKWNLKYLSLPLLWVYNFVAFPFLLYKIRKINPDVIYCNSTLDAYSIWFAKILGKKHVTHIREFAFEDFGARFILGRKLKRKYILLSDKIICVSHAVANKVFQDIPKKCRIIYNGISLPKKEFKYKILDGNLRIGVVGNIDISKRQDLAIHMMSKIVERYPDMTLHIIGDKKCSYRDYIHKLVEDLHLRQSVIFDGFIMDTEKIYQKFDVLLMCSRSEAFGRVTIEAMLRNKPVIGFDSGGTSELIDDGVTGFKFLDYEGVLKALNCIVHEPQRTSKIVLKAKNVAERNFNENRYVKDIYEFVISRDYL